MKPTWGLVPYTGVMPIELTLDHTGPMTATVADNALLLEVIAGADGLDPRQVNVKTAPYTEALGKSIAGLRIGVVQGGLRLAAIGIRRGRDGAPRCAGVSQARCGGRRRLDPDACQRDADLVGDRA